ncbi:MAG: Glucosamine-6-phosphate isomerase/6-phosphogluconolactonase [Candidatus Parcubacteria bacterium]|jgi:6-phosphogluconolactonase/glucosamine-6-phosphate isomerase/deaminase
MTSNTSKHIHIATSKAPAEEAGKYISDILALSIDKPVLLLVAGGSAMSVLEYINPEYIENNLTVTVTDERFTEDVGDNNFATMQTYPFYNSLIDVDAFCINTELFAGDTIELFRDRFEKNIRDWKKEFLNGVIIGLFGMGADGHVAGIIPGIYSEEEFAKKFDGEAYATDVDATGKNEHPLRMTTTFPFMRMIDHPLFYIVGENKRDALVRATATEGTLFETPARIMLEMNNPEIFTDLAL